MKGECAGDSEGVDEGAVKGERAGDSESVGACDREGAVEGEDLRLVTVRAQVRVMCDSECALMVTV